MADVVLSSPPYDLKRATHRHQPWWVLAGLRDPMFDMERELRWFQIKHWLTGAVSMREAFGEAALLFGACYLTSKINGYDRASASWRVKDALKVRSTAIIFSHCFRHGDIRRLSDTRRVEKHAEERHQRRFHDKYWLELAQSRIDLSNTIVGVSIGRAEYWLKRKDIDDVYSVSQAEKNKDTKANAVFMLAAKSCLPSLLDYQFDSEKLLDQLQLEVPDKEIFVEFCRTVRAISQRLSTDEDAFIEAVVGVDATDSLPFTPVPPEIIAELHTGTRRSASETSRGKRQGSAP